LAQTKKSVSQIQPIAESTCAGYSLQLSQLTLIGSAARIVLPVLDFR
jgi:hypothetical protein